MLEFIQTGSREEAEELGIIEKKKSGKMPENPPEKGEPHSDPLDVRVRSDTKKEKGVKKPRRQSSKSSKIMNCFQTDLFQKE